MNAPGTYLQARGRNAPEPVAVIAAAGSVAVMGNGQQATVWW